MMFADKDLVSIIIPAYNNAGLLEEALNSIFAQTFQNFEIIVVDDGSTDDTANVLRSLAEQGVIRYFYQKNMGVSFARNRGIVEAKGQYITFLDSDDLFEPMKLDIQLKYLYEHPRVGLVHSGFTKFDNAGNDLGYRDTSWFSDEVYPEILLYWTTLMAINTVLVPRKTFDTVGLFDTTLSMGEDLDLWRRIARVYPFGFINQSLARVRVHEGNTSGNKLRATDELYKYLEKAFADDPALTKQFKQRAVSRMLGTMAYNLLSENSDEALKFARLNARRAIVSDPLNSQGYLALLSTLFGNNLRQILIHQWRSVRAFLMSRNRSI